MEAKRQKTIRLLLAAVALDILDFGILLPILPLLFATPDSPYYLLGDASPKLG